MTKNLKRDTIELISRLHCLQDKTTRIATFNAARLPDTKKGVQLACLEIFKVFYDPRTRTTKNKALIEGFTRNTLLPLLSRLEHPDKPTQLKRTSKK